MDLDLTDTDQPDNFLLPTLLPSFFIRTTEFGPEAQVVLIFFRFWGRKCVVHQFQFCHSKDKLFSVNIVIYL